MKENRQKDIGFILLHGVGLGAWIWEDFISEIEYPCLAVDLPGRGKHAEKSNKGLSLHEYVDSVLLDITRFSPEKLIIVAHSISGIIGLEVADKLKNRVIGFIGISASIPPHHGSYISSLPFLSGLFLRLMFMMAGTRPPDSAIQKVLCNDLDEKCTSKIIDHFVPESKKLYTDKIQTQSLPENTLYILLKNDRALNEAIQVRMVNNLQAKEVINIYSGHLPMFSKYMELANICKNFTSSLL